MMGDPIADKINRDEYKRKSYKQAYLDMKSQRDDAEYDASEACNKAAKLSIENDELRSELERVRQQIKFLEGVVSIRG
jgi:predicted  nucleic acid-binding Zn-ribbon protein